MTIALTTLAITALFWKLFAALQHVISHLSIATAYPALLLTAAARGVTAVVAPFSNHGVVEVSAKGFPGDVKDPSFPLNFLGLCATLLSGYLRWAMRHGSVRYGDVFNAGASP